MIKFFTLFSILIIISAISGFSQISVPGIPESFAFTTKSATILPNKELHNIDNKRLAEEDNNLGISNRYGEIEDVNIDLIAEGTKTIIAGRGYIWRYRIESSNTFSLGIFFSKFRIPEGAKIFIYNDDRTQVAGAFTSKNNNIDNQLAIAEFKGKNATIEYFEPFGSESQAELEIGYVSQSYKNIFGTMQTIIGINCPEGADWQLQKHSVCMITYNENRYAYYCTGTLVNNTRNDGTPYFLTAHHCLSSSTAATSLVVYFNYESSICNGATSDVIQTLAGSALLSTSTYTDFTLLKLNDIPPYEYEPYYAGWDATGSASQNSTSIHHPGGRLKSIAIDNNPPTTGRQTINWDDGSVTVPNTHWQVYFDVGQVENGSSGGPLFNDKKRVIGQLHGGDNNYNYFGKFSISWKRYSSPNQQLAAWLDPDNTNAFILDGFASTKKPEADFSASASTVCINAPVKFYDRSKYLASEWSWSFLPSTVEFINGTNSHSKYPEVTFLQEGNYTVELTATNPNGSTTISKENYISAGTKINVSLTSYSYNGSDICGPFFKNVSFVAKGANTYTFTLTDPDKFNYRMYNDSIVLSTKDTISQTFKTYLIATGTQGSCIDSDSVALNASYSENDNVAKAALLKIGINGPFPNFCASVEPNEPHPSTLGCQMPNSWCTKGSDSVLHNTIWFKFLGPPNGSVTIDTKGFNDRIALYSAESAQDLTSRMASLYKLIAANDSRALFDSTALLKNISLEPGKTYWLQLDGYNGESGNAYVNLITNNVEALPNPNDGAFDIIISTGENREAVVSIYDILGNKIFTQNVKISNESNRFKINLKPISSGVYFIGINMGDTEQRKKIVIFRQK
jgi:PKD repeat protein